MDKEIKMKLLEMLMDEMDDEAVSKLKKPEVAVAIETEEVPVSAEDIKEKMMPEPDMELESEPEEDYDDSRLMQRLKDIKAKKM